MLNISIEKVEMWRYRCVENLHNWVVGRVIDAKEKG